MSGEMKIETPHQIGPPVAEVLWGAVDGALFVLREAGDRQGVRDDVSAPADAAPGGARCVRAAPRRRQGVGRRRVVRGAARIIRCSCGEGDGLGECRGRGSQARALLEGIREPGR